MMRCPKCDGHGFELLANRFGRIRKLECDLCNGTGYLPTTNEEWLHTLNTEQKAEWIAKQKCDGCNDYPYDDKHGTCKYCMTKKTEQIREWLKQPHREE